MATAAQKKAALKAKAAAAAAAAAAAEVEEEEEVEETETPKANAVTFGVADLAALIKEKTGKIVTTRELRTLLRKMARDKRINREIIAGNRARYDWTGPADPEVRAALKAFKSGELEADKQEKLAALKERKAAKKAAAAAAAPVEDDDDDEDIEDEDDD